MLENFKFRGHIVITYELLSINLYELLKVNNFTGLNESLVRRIAIQLLATLIFLNE